MTIRIFSAKQEEACLVRCLASRDRASQSIPDSALAEMPAEAAALFLTQQISRAQSRHLWRMAACKLLAVCFLSLFADVTGSTWRGRAAFVWCLPFAIAIVVGASPSRLHRACIDRLCRRAGPEGFAILAANVTARFPVEAELAARALAPFLPQISAAQWKRVTRSPYRLLFEPINGIHRVGRGITDATKSDLARQLVLARHTYGSATGVFADDARSHSPQVQDR